MGEQMIRILSRKKFRFPNPGVKILGFDTDTSQVNVQPDFKNAYFETTPGEPEYAPAWIKKDRMFEWASKDGDLMEIAEPTKEVVAPAVAQAVQQMSEAAQRGEEQLSGDTQKEEAQETSAAEEKATPINKKKGK